ncbi:hypothetical protein BaRGS_00001662 [Batillaria attramentaria]|uniref:Galectin n=1 Tax=Batillaria attramentaria TaxID=370345 RepID=A0ABD0M5V1_9CAEN
MTRHISTIFCFILCVCMTTMTVASWPGLDLDKIDVYKVTNVLQCKRLCRYRKLCARYSYTYGDTASSDGNNCVLHAQASGVAHGGWLQEVSQPINNVCGTQPCSETEVCVPGPTPPLFTCLALPAEHARARILAINYVGSAASEAFDRFSSRDASPPLKECIAVLPEGFVGDGTSQGHVATPVCDPLTLWFPRESLPSITCLVTSRWSAYSGDCKRAIYENSVCMTCHEMVFNFHNDYDGAGDIVLQVDMRGDYGAYLYQKYHVWWNTRSGGAWGSQTQIGAMPLTAGETFEMTLTVHADNLEIAIVGKTPVRVVFETSPLRPDLSAVKSLKITWDVLLHYVNLGSAC